MPLKDIIILVLILVSLLPFYLAGRYLQKKLQPKTSFSRFFAWMALMMLMIFVYTFLLVFTIRMLFPRA